MGEYPKYSRLYRKVSNPELPGEIRSGNSERLLELVIKKERLMRDAINLKDSDKGGLSTFDSYHDNIRDNIISVLRELIERGHKLPLCFGMIVFDCDKLAELDDIMTIVFDDEKNDFGSDVNNHFLIQCLDLKDGSAEFISVLRLIGDFYFLTVNRDEKKIPDFNTLDILAHTVENFSGVSNPGNLIN